MSTTAITFERTATLDEALDAAFANQQDYYFEPGKFSSPLFQFAREVKRHLPDATAKSALQVVQRWMARRDFSWLDFCDIEDEDEAIEEFEAAWDSIRYADGEDPLSVAWAKANADPVTFASGYTKTPKYCLFVALCYWLQVGKGPDQNIFLPTRRLSALFETKDQGFITNVKKKAMRDGLIVLVDDSGRAQRYADEYRADLAKIAR